ncbi:hypothetical protein D9M68_584820 [compost metagenome]
MRDVVEGAVGMHGDRAMAGIGRAQGIADSVAVDVGGTGQGGAGDGRVLIGGAVAIGRLRLIVNPIELHRCGSPTEGPVTQADGVGEAVDQQLTGGQAAVGLAGEEAGGVIDDLGLPVRRVLGDRDACSIGTQA